MILVLGASSASGPTLRPSRPRHIRYPRDTAQIRTMLLEYLGNWRAMARRGIVEARDLTRPAELPARKGPGRKPRFTYEFRGEGSLSTRDRIELAEFNWRDSVG